jgi:hypothetical protein
MQNRIGLQTLNYYGCKYQTNISLSSFMIFVNPRQLFGDFSEINRKSANFRQSRGIPLQVEALLLTTSSSCQLLFIRRISVARLTITLVLAYPKLAITNPKLTITKPNYPKTKL